MGNLLSPAGTPRQMMQLVTDMLTTRSVSAAIFTEVHDALGSEATVALLTVINRWAGLALMLNALDVDIYDGARITVPVAPER
ncbi:MAG: hypothetical protein QOF66_5684 [Mycobacterium sp.]|nr:hypothetical protein [Mycobacterium sp.]